MITYHFYEGSVKGLTTSVVHVRAENYKLALMIVKEFIRKGLKYRPHCRG